MAFFFALTSTIAQVVYQVVGHVLIKEVSTYVNKCRYDAFLGILREMGFIWQVKFLRKFK